jgi:hypothetical protein
MKELTEELKKDIGLKLFEFFYSYTREGDDKFDAKYPDYKKFSQMRYPYTEYMGKIIDDGMMD